MLRGTVKRIENPDTHRSRISNPAERQDWGKLLRLRLALDLWSLRSSKNFLTLGRKIHFFCSRLIEISYLCTQKKL